MPVSKLYQTWIGQHKKLGTIYHRLAEIHQPCPMPVPKLYLPFGTGAHTMASGAIPYLELPGNGQGYIVQKRQGLHLPVF